MSRHRLFTPPGSTATIVGSSGLVTSTMPSPQLSPINAYSRPDPAGYPQQSAQLAPPGMFGNAFSGIHVLRLTFLETNDASVAPPGIRCELSSFHGSGDVTRPSTAGFLSSSFLSSSSAHTRVALPAIVASVAHTVSPNPIRAEPPRPLR